MMKLGVLRYIFWKLKRSHQQQKSLNTKDLLINVIVDLNIPDLYIACSLKVPLIFRKTKTEGCDPCAFCAFAKAENHSFSVVC
jgi:hypothetical protein